jgi:NAD(P)-dependent dehydrogenase (short-subunit alcohol dehydrogenase family)
MAERRVASQIAMIGIAITGLRGRGAAPIQSNRRWTMSLEVANTDKTVIVTGGSQGIGAGAVRAFLDRGYRVVANSRNITKSHRFEGADRLALVDGNISEARTAEGIVEVAMSKFGSIDVLINNAGIYFSKPFIEYTIDDLHALISVNIEGFFFISQFAIKQMLAQKSGGSIVNITSTLVDHPIAGANASIPMMTKGGLEAVTRNLAMEYAKQGIRVNAVAPGIVDTPMHTNNPKDFLKTLQPMGQISSVKDIVDAIVYLTEAGQVTGEVLHVDGGAHIGKW